MTAVDLSADISLWPTRVRGLPVLSCQDMSAWPDGQGGRDDTLPGQRQLCHPARRPAPGLSLVYRYLRPGDCSSSTPRRPRRWRRRTARSIWMRRRTSTASGGGSTAPGAGCCSYGIDLFRRRPDRTWDRGGEAMRYAYTPERAGGASAAAGFQQIRRYGDAEKTPSRPGRCGSFLPRKEMIARRWMR